MVDDGGFEERRGFVADLFACSKEHGATLPGDAPFLFVATYLALEVEVGELVAGGVADDEQFAVTLLVLEEVLVNLIAQFSRQFKELARHDLLRGKKSVGWQSHLSVVSSFEDGLMRVCFKQTAVRSSCLQTPLQQSNGCVALAV